MATFGCDVSCQNNLDHNVDILNGKWFNFNFKCMGKIFQFQVYGENIWPNSLKYSEKIPCVCQRLIYPIMEKQLYLTMLVFFKCHLVFRVLH